MKRTGILLIFLFIQLSLKAQQKQDYPCVGGYVGIVHPLVTFGNGGVHTNFENSYTVGMPTGINIWKSQRVGFSVEAVPFIRVENGTSRMNNFLFHPGVLLALGDGFTFVGRAAFETSGRYGFTPIINKVIKKNANSSYLIAVPFPVRLGNNMGSTAGVALQFALAF